MATASIIKPSNIIITSDGRVKLIDFGLSDGAQYATFKHNAGSDGFAAPEQHEGKPADHRADIYALGGIMRMLAPWRHHRAARHALRHAPERRPGSVAKLRRLMRPRWPWYSLAIAIMAAAAILSLIPTERRYSTALESGQRVRYRVLHHFPHREVALVSSAGTTPLQGEMLIPPTIRHRGLRYRVVEIDNEAFYKQSGITKLSLPEGLRSIGIEAFCYCSGLRDTLVVPTTLRHIGCGAFNDCPSLSHVEWQADSCEVELKAEVSAVIDRDYALRQIHVTSNVRWLPGYLFRATGNMRLAVIDGEIQELDHDVFAYNEPLDSVVLPPSLRVIGHAAFYETSIRHLVLPDSLTEVGTYAFAYDNQLRSIDMGSCVQSIGNYAFVQCTQLATVRLRAMQPPEVMEASFMGMPPTAVLHVPVEALDVYRSHPVWGRFKVIAF